MVRWGWALATWGARHEAPTWILAGTIYSGWAALTFYWHNLPLWMAAPAGAWLCAWHMSLQHELIHGHPTCNGRLNTALASPPLNLWLPFPLYRDEHLRHHHDAHLTDPLEDPESTYFAPAQWARASLARRLLHTACNTAIGRILLGPASAIASLWLRQARRHAQRPWDRMALLVWRDHAIEVGIVLVWVCGICHISLLTYIACVAYPGTALIMVRSLAEHRAAPHAGDRTAIVEQAGLFGLLFLHNNLHLLHHERPSIPWYKLPAQWRLARAGLLGTRQGPVYQGYREVFRRYATTPHHAGPHPFAGFQPPSAAAAERHELAAPSDSLAGEVAV